MTANHSRRLDKLEVVSRPNGRVVFIWDTRKPGCVAREKARLIADGSIGPQDHIVTIGWQQ